MKNFTKAQRHSIYKKLQTIILNDKELKYPSYFCTNLHIILREHYAEDLATMSQDALLQKFPEIEHHKPNVMKDQLAWFEGHRYDKRLTIIKHALKETTPTKK